MPIDAVSDRPAHPRPSLVDRPQMHPRPDQLSEDALAEHFAQQQGEYACYSRPIRACYHFADGPICELCLANYPCRRDEEEVGQ